MILRSSLLAVSALIALAATGTLDGCVPEEEAARTGPQSAAPSAAADTRPETAAPENVVAEGSTPGIRKYGIFYTGSVIASDPSIVRTPEGYAMFYTDLDVRRNRTAIARADSRDGINWSTGWVKNGIKGLVIAGRDGEWDENVESPAALEVGGKWMLYFSGYRDKGTPIKGFPAALWLATSQNGRDFTRASSDPVMRPTKGWYDNDAVYSPTLLHEGGTYYMIYVGHAYTDTSKIPGGGVFLLSATSADGVNWKKDERPVARPGQFPDWRREGIAEPYLVKKGPGEYLLFYTGLQGEKRAIGVATAPTPRGPWDFGSKPIILPGPRGAPDEHQVLAPAAVVEGGKVRLWFLGANRKEMLRIGYAEGTVREMLEESR